MSNRGLGTIKCCETRVPLEDAVGTVRAVYGLLKQGRAVARGPVGR